MPMVCLRLCCWRGCWHIVASAGIAVQQLPFLLAIRQPSTLDAWVLQLNLSQYLVAGCVQQLRNLQFLRKQVVGGRRDSCRF